MRTKLTLEIERDGKWFVGSCPEVPGANGQGRTFMSCSHNLLQAVALLLDEEEAPAISTSIVDVEIAGIAHRYTVELIESWEGVSIRCSDLPGCVSQGDDPDEALENIRSAIKDYVEVAEEIRQRDSHLVKVA